MTPEESDALWREHEAKRPLPGQHVCQVPGCSASLWWIKRGERPKFCTTHRARKRKPLGDQDELHPVHDKTVGGDYAERRRREDADGRRIISAEVLNERLLALAMRVEPNPERAATLIGLGKDADGISEMIEAATSNHYQGLREGRQSETAKTVSAAMSILAERLLAEVWTVKPSQIPQSLQALAKANESLGGFKMSYSNVTISLGSPREGEE